jgi:pimeloyl-ACP methyl ester carboxylesterase
MYIHLDMSPGLLVPLLGLLLGSAALVLVSLLLEALRTAPTPPARAPWAPDIPIRYVTVDGTQIRYVVAGEGPSLVLLHTLRTQLDMFQKVLPDLARDFRVYALDYPGHGYSDIPRARYSAELFIRAVAGFLDRLGIENATLAGESIGGTVALALAARHAPRVRRVVAINPYDYDAGRGLRRSSLLARLLLAVNDVPVLGATVARLRLPPVVNRVFRGGVARAESFPRPLLEELYRVGNRKGHYRAFMSLIRESAGWEKLRAEYPSIDRPVLLLYGDRDWSRTDEREANAAAIPGARMRVVENAGHFLSLDAPRDLVHAVRQIGNQVEAKRLET